MSSESAVQGSIKDTVKGEDGKALEAQAGSGSTLLDQVSRVHPQPSSVNDSSVQRYPQLLHMHMFLSGCQRMSGMHPYGAMVFCPISRCMHQVCTSALSKSALLDNVADPSLP